MSIELLQMVQRHHDHQRNDIQLHDIQLHDIQQKKNVFDTQHDDTQQA